MSNAYFDKYGYIKKLQDITKILYYYNFQENKRTFKDPKIKYKLEMIFTIFTDIYYIYKYKQLTSQNKYWLMYVTGLY